MFRKSLFNSDISSWDVSNVESMVYMFDDSPFNQDISLWNLNPKVIIKDMFYMSRCKKEFRPMLLKRHKL